MGMLKEGVRLDRVRGGRQKYRRNPATHPYHHQLMMSQTAQTAGGLPGAATLDDIKMLETLLAGEPDVISVGAEAAELMWPERWRAAVATSSGATRMDADDEGTSENDGRTVDRKPNAAALTAAAAAAVAATAATNAIETDGPATTECSPYAVPEVLGVLSDLYDKELVGVIGWAKQIPGTVKCHRFLAMHWRY